MSQIKKRRFIMRASILLVLSVLVAYSLYANITKHQDGNLAVGDKAPNFVLTDMNGKKQQLSDYKGKGVLLNFWGTWCQPCKQEMPAMNELYKEYQNRGVQILAVHVVNTTFLVRQFIQQYHLSFPVLIDRNKDVQHAYNIAPLPTTILIGPDGRIKNIVVGNQHLTKNDFIQMMDVIKP